MDRVIDPGVVKNLKNDESPREHDHVEDQAGSPIVILMGGRAFLQGLFDICPHIL
jgi:hypothetical protein